MTSFPAVLPFPDPLRRQATNFRVKHYDVLGRTYSNYTLDQVSCSQLLPVLNLLSYP